MNASKYSRITLKPGTPTPYTNPRRTIVRFYVEGREAVNSVVQFALNRTKGWVVAQHLFSINYCVDVTDDIADAVESYLAALPDNPETERKYLVFWLQDGEAARLHVCKTHEERAGFAKILRQRGDIEEGDHLMFADIAGFECPAFYDVDIEAVTIDGVVYTSREDT